MIEILREFVGTTASDTILDHYIDTARQSIKAYLNYKEDEMDGLFQVQIINLAKFYYENRKTVGISQQSQGIRSQSFEKGIPLEIKDSLPMPRVRVVGGGK